MTIYIASGKAETSFGNKRHVYYLSAKDHDDAESQLNTKVIESSVFGVTKFHLEELRALTDYEIITTMCATDRA